MKMIFMQMIMKNLTLTQLLLPLKNMVLNGTMLLLLNNGVKELPKVYLLPMKTGTPGHMMTGTTNILLPHNNQYNLKYNKLLLPNTLLLNINNLLKVMEVERNTITQN